MTVRHARDLLLEMYTFPGVLTCTDHFTILEGYESKYPGRQDIRPFDRLYKADS